jgi:uncharacterized membrane protein
MDSLFEFLFKYRPLMFERGDLAFATPWPAYLGLTVLVAVAVPTVFMYARVRGKSLRRDRIALAAIRTAVLALLLFSLFRPVLVLSTVVPQRNFLGILIDDSRSMQIADRDGEPRSGFVQHNFGLEESKLLHELSERFILRFFKFASSSDRITDLSELSFTGSQTNIGRALDRARQELSSVPLAGLVTITDGADNANEALTEPLLALRARSVPVYTVGLGRESFSRDIEVSRVETPRTVLKGSSLVVDVMVTQTGFRGSTVELQVEDAGQIVSTQEVELPARGEAATARVHFTANKAGPRLFRFRIPPQPGEMVTQNNEQEALIVVEDRKEKILYFEGEPRFEVKFLRRAVTDDENIQVVTLLRTAENKFLRLDVDDEEELVGGFPKTREELFGYRGIILGSVEASFFTHDQLRMISDFVSQRGGGLLMLGGRRAFAEGGYTDTPIEDVLPVVLESPVDDGEEPFVTEIKVALTPSGMTHAATQLGSTSEETAERWRMLPPVTMVNPIRRIKPGATTLLTGDADDLSGSPVVLAFQRYGRGKALAFPVQDSWTWQMHAEIPLDDMTHETLWRQLLRWLVSGVPDRVNVRTPTDRAAPNEPVELIAEVEDDTFLRVNNTEVEASVTSPSGEMMSARMEWTVDRDGEYRVDFTPSERGLHEIHVQALEDGEFLASETSYIQVTDLASEYFDAEMRPTVLRRIAEETGGRFYTPETVSTLAEDLSYTESGTTVLEQKELWDMPIVFFLVVLLVSGEWTYRRWRRLV